MASCLAAVGRAPEAVEAYRRALAADPDYAQPRYNLAVLLERTGGPEEVASLLRGYLRREPSGACAEDARRRLHVAELRASGALGAPAPLPEDTAERPFLDSSQEEFLYEPGGGPPSADPT